MSDAARDAERVLAEADCLHDAQAVQGAYDRLAIEIGAHYAGRNPLLLCVMTGGLVPTAEVTRRLAFPFELDYLHATRYRGATLALHSTVGFGLSAVGGWAVGAAIDAAGGATSANGWTAAFMVMGAGILLGPLALWWSRR